MENGRTLAISNLSQYLSILLSQYRGENKGLIVLLSRTQSEQLSKSKKKFLATTYTPLFSPLYFTRVISKYSCYHIARPLRPLFGRKRKGVRQVIRPPEAFYLARANGGEKIWGVTYGEYDSSAIAIAITAFAGGPFTTRARAIIGDCEIRQSLRDLSLIIYKNPNLNLISAISNF